MHCVVCVSVFYRASETLVTANIWITQTLCSSLLLKPAGWKLFPTSTGKQVVTNEMRDPHAQIILHQQYPYCGDADLSQNSPKFKDSM